MLNYDAFRAAVIHEANVELHNKPWFRGVCTDKMRPCYDSYVAASGSKEQFAVCVNLIVIDTRYYDDPHFMS